MVCYGLIIKHVYVTRLRILSFSPTSNKKEKRKQTINQDKYVIQLTKLCAILVSSFVVCWILYHSFRVAKMRYIYNVQVYIVNQSNILPIFNHTN